MHKLTNQKNRQDLIIFKREKNKDKEKLTSLQQRELRQRQNHPRVQHGLNEVLHWFHEQPYANKN